MGERINRGGFEPPEPPEHIRHQVLRQVRTLCLYSADVFTIVTGFYDGNVSPPRGVWDLVRLLRVVDFDWTVVRENYLADFYSTSQDRITKPMIYQAAEIYSLWHQETTARPYLDERVNLESVADVSQIPISSFAIWLEEQGTLTSNKFNPKYGKTLNKSLLEYWGDDLKKQLPVEAEAEADEARQRYVHKVNTFYFPSLVRVFDYFQKRIDRKILE